MNDPIRTTFKYDHSEDNDPDNRFFRTNESKL
jgi:hypothetical protein